MAHLCRAERADERYQTRTFNGLHVIEIHRRLVLETLIDAHGHFARRTASCGSNRGHHDGMQQRNHFLPRENQDRSALVG